MRKAHKFVAFATFAAAFAAAPMVPAFAQDKVEYKEVKRDDMPREVRRAADQQAAGATEVKYQRQLRDGKTFYSVHFTKDGDRLETRLDESGKVVDGPHAARDPSGTSSGGGKRNDDAGVKYHGIATHNAKKEIPADVLRTMDKETQGAKDLFYQRQDRGGKIFYSVHYNKDGKRQFIRVAENGQLAVGPQESKPSGTGTSGGATAEASKPAEPGIRREAITADDLPNPVRRTVEQTANNGGGHAFIRETKGNEVSYVIEWEVGETRTSERLSADGKVLVASPLAANAVPTPPGQNDAQVAAAREAAAQTAAKEAEAREMAAREAAARETAAREGAARDAATAAANAAPYQILSDTGQLPAPVRAAIEQPLSGGSAPLFQRFTQDGRTLYSVHFTNAKGQRQFMAVDAAGKVAIEPRKSNSQEGGRDVQFQQIGTDQMPAEVRKVIEEQAGRDHLFLQRTEGNDRTFLVQYTDADGKRLESHIAADGKVTMKPRAAREQPFTILDRKGD